MDDRLTKALDFANYRSALFNRKGEIKLAVDTMMKYAINGGIFQIDRELINFVRMLLDQDRTEVVLVDANENPIRIDDLPTFFDEIFSRYFEATNFYHLEYTKLRKARTVEEIMQMGKL